MRHLRILGIRGVPAAHGGFETFAEHLALYLVQRGWRVTVYCQVDGAGPTYVDHWRGVDRVNIPIAVAGPRGTMLFDWRTIVHAARSDDLCLTLGYNTAAFCAWLRLRGVRNVINMDGIEWARAKWGRLAKTWFFLNEIAGCWLGNHLVADNPEIQRHLGRRISTEKVTMIPYGAEQPADASVDPVKALGLIPGQYLTLIARPEPENSILEVVRGFSSQPRPVTLAVLGNFDAANPYHQTVRASASADVRFLGAIYDKQVVQSLRTHCLAYIHGHQVGGTNPSLVEALGAGNAVVAHDNRFNRWVAGSGALYFDGVDAFATVLSQLLADPSLLSELRASALARFHDGLTWPQVLQQYEQLLEAQCALRRQ